MAEFLKEYGVTLGPIGIPMTDDQARDLEPLLKDIPDGKPVRKAISPNLLELAAGERADVAWISTEAVDHDKEIVLASGMDDSHFSKNPMVTLGHSYWSPPVGKSLWRRKVADEGKRGILAKTHYPPRPDSWPAERTWEPDEVFGLVQAGLCLGKSIGFLTLESHAPTEEEMRKNPGWVNVRRVITKWLLVEYACTWMPCQPEALVANVSKATRKALGLSEPEPAPVASPVPASIPFTPWPAIEKTIAQTIRQTDVARIAQRAAQAALDQHLGRV